MGLVAQHLPQQRASLIAGSYLLMSETLSVRSSVCLPVCLPVILWGPRHLNQKSLYKAVTSVNKCGLREGSLSSIYGSQGSRRIQKNTWGFCNITTL